MSHDHASMINNLIKFAKDGELGFRKAAENTNDAYLKTIFETRAQGCQTAVTTLQTHVVGSGSNVEQSGSILGTLHRGWIDVLSTVTNNDNHAILNECKRGEMAAKQAYQEALGKSLTPELKSTLESQYQGVAENINLITDLMQQYATA